MKFKSGAQRKAVMAKLRNNNVSIEQTFVPRGAGNNPRAGALDSHYKIKEWGYVFPDRNTAVKYANEHKEENGVIVKIKRGNK
jgi:hypothetical protein